MTDRSLTPPEVLEVTGSLAEEVENTGYDCQGSDPMMCIITGKCLAQPGKRCQAKE